MHCKGFLSNFYSSLVWYSGYAFATVEHAYQAAKATNARDLTYVRSASSPSIAKRRGREIPCVPNWEGVKVAIMHKLLLSKFEHPKLREQLLATGTEELIHENNHGDTFWGCVDGQGENMLGKLLMQVREEARCAHTQ